jgi:acyl-CoA reductase-like NAD-dependent aldehyde dehydrogenase
MQTITKHYIDGAFVESHGSDVMDIIKPTNGQVIAPVTLADEEDTRHAIAAKSAFATFGRSTKEERTKILRRLHQAASARVDDLTAAMVEEYGGVVRFAGLIVQSTRPSLGPTSSARVASQIRAGRVVINNMTDDPQAPWGEFKYSSIGREYGRDGIEAFLEPRAILE